VKLVAAVAGHEEERWILLRGATRRGARIASGRFGDALISHRELQGLLGIDGQQEIAWVVVEAALPCQNASATDHSHGHHHHGHHGTLTPFARLLSILRPEAGDIWVVAGFSAVVSILSLATPIAVESLVNTVAFGRFMQPVVVLSVVLLGFLGFASLLRILQTYIAEIIQRRLFVRVVADLSHRLPRVKQEAFDGAHGPELLNRFFDVMTVQKSAALLVLDGIAIVLQTAVGMAVLAFYHPMLAGFDVVLLACLAFIVFVLGRGAVRTSIDESIAKYEVASWLEQIAQCSTTFKSSGTADFAADRADMLATRYILARRSHFNILLRQLAFTLGLQALAGSVLLGIGGWLVIGGQLTLGQLVASELIVAVIVGSFAKLGKHLESFYDLLAAVDKLGHLFDLPMESTGGEILGDSRRPARLSIEGFLVDHSAGAESSPIEIQPGEMVAIASTGAESMRLVDHLFGLRSHGHGSCEVDGVDVRSLDRSSLRSHLALARGTELIVGSVSDNVHLNRDGVSLADVRLALQQVHLYDEVCELEDGPNTLIQPNGYPLADSQVRRLVLARALAAHPRLLIVSELLDGLPDQTLVEVMRSLRESAESTTIVVITGRRDIAEACDRSIGPQFEPPAPESTGLASNLALQKT
jgi:putative ABC transport system ATP-binding protein